MDGVTGLAKKGERVLALAQLVLNKNIYNINIAEPIIENKYDDDIDETILNNDEDAVIVVYRGKKHKITIEKYDDDKNKIKLQDFTIKDIMIGFENKLKKEKGGTNYVPVGSQRMAFSDHGELLSPDASFRELGIGRGSKLHCFRGPYKFSGTSAENINWPLFRELDDGTREEGLVFLGLYAMIDPPRPGVPEAVGKCQSAGIKVVMVTGDHPITAKAIAEQVGIIHENSLTREQSASKLYYGNIDLVKEEDYDAVVVAGWELQLVLDEEMDDPQKVADFWNRVLNKKNIVFARTSPQQKLLIVSAVQERGGIVAVTGDGVNDSPALKKADIGVAMGITGTEVAKEAADMILLDDNFASIVNGIEEGRIIFDNLKKSIAYTLSSNIPEISPFLLFQVMGLPLALSTQMILLVDLGTDLAPAISMAYEGKESDIMHRKPRDPDREKLVTWRLVSFAYLQIGMLQAISGFYAYVTVLHAFGIMPGMLTGLDSYGIFDYDPGQTSDSRDAYWLYCWDSNIDYDCQYFPNFGNLFGDGGPQNYDQIQWESWINNDDDYVKDAKNYLVSRFENIDFPDSVNANCTQLQECCFGLNNDCDELTYQEWIDSYWSQVRNVWANDIHKSKLIKNRRCFTEGDYASSYTDSGDGNPQNCDRDDFNDKPRTFSEYPGGEGSAEPAGTKFEFRIFPMDMRTRTEALFRSQTSYFISIIIVQWADLMICKTRIRSLFEQGMTNTFMNYSLFFETILGAFLTYVPFANNILQTRPLRFTWWTAAVPFCILIYIYDECRKGWIRKNQRGWVHRNTYW